VAVTDGRGVLVEVQQPLDGVFAFVDGVAGGEGTGVHADQIVHPVPAESGFVHEVVAVQRVEMPDCLFEW
jgi:hypothetical protein